VWLDSHAILDLLAISYDRDGPGDVVERRRPSIELLTDEEIMTRTTMLACSARGRHNHSTRVPPLLSAGHIGPARGRKAGATLGLPTPSFLSISFFFFLSLTLVPWFLPLNYKR
jgi:hypothetical protein